MSDTETTPHDIIRLELAYHGSSFCGWQIQPQQRSVQGELMAALKTLYKTDIRVIGAGRTDAGVHAEQQVAHFELPRGLQGPPLEKLPRSLNALTHEDLLVLELTKTDPNFHARFKPHLKTYHYHFDLHDRPHPLLKDRACHQRGPWSNLEDGHAFCSALVGTHDFGSYCSIQNNTESTVRSILDAKLIQRTPQHWLFEIRGKGFLQHMVRILAGTLSAILEGDLALSTALEALRGPGHREQLGTTLPAHGLWLHRTEYLEQDYWQGEN